MSDVRQNTNTSELLSMQLGQAGVDNITSTSAVSCATVSTGAATQWFALQAIGTTVISTLTETNASGTFTSVTIPDMSVIFGSFTAVTLTSGRLRAYREPLR